MSMVVGSGNPERDSTREQTEQGHYEQEGLCVGPGGLWVSCARVGKLNQLSLVRDGFWEFSGMGSICLGWF